jgi:hypothetical protein
MLVLGFDKCCAVLCIELVLGAFVELFMEIRKTL